MEPVTEVMDIDYSAELIMLADPSTLVEAWVPP